MMLPSPSPVVTVAGSESFYEEGRHLMHVHGVGFCPPMSMLDFRVSLCKGRRKEGIRILQEFMAV